MATCACGAPIIGRRLRCVECAYTHNLMMSQRRRMAKRVPPDQLDAALAQQNTKREELEKHRARLRDQYAELSRHRPHKSRGAA